MLQRLPIASAQVKAGNTSENLLNEIWQIIHSLYRVKEITENIYIKNNEFNKIIIQNEYYIYEFWQLYVMKEHKKWLIMIQKEYM